MPEHQAILLALATTWRGARPIKKTAVWCGKRFYRERLNFLLVGIFTAVFVTLSERVPGWFLSDWVTVVRLATDNFFRLRKTHIILNVQHAPLQYAVANGLIWPLWAVACLAIFPPGWRVTADVGLARFILGTIAAWYEYVLADGPMAREKVRWTMQLDATVGYFLSTWLLRDGFQALSLAHRLSSKALAFLLFEVGYQFGFSNSLTLTVIFPLATPAWFYSALEWAFLAALCLSPLVWVLLQWNVSSQTASQALTSSRWLRKVKSLLITASTAWDLYELAEAYIVYSIPKAIQTSRCQFEQAERRREGSSDYEYSALKSREIRLLVLERSNSPFAGSIRATILPTSLDSAPAFEAVSYRWGSNDRVEEIILNGKNFAVTTSAFNLLLARRSIWRQRVIWIDAICINQADNLEKSQQVQMMCVIYRFASRVVIFPQSNASARLAAGLLYEHGVPAIDHLPNSDGLELRGLNRPTSSTSFSTPRWSALATLLAQEYFSRAWIVQEITVGRDVQLYLGGHYVSWAAFQMAVVRLITPEILHLLTLAWCREASPDVDAKLQVANILVINSLRSDSPWVMEGGVRHQTELLQLANLLSITSDFQATDPRDKIFAMLSISTQEEQSGPVLLDYTKSLMEVLEDVATKLLVKQSVQAINLLPLAGTGFLSNLQAIEKSWIPDFRRSQIHSTFTSSFIQRPRFQASGQAIARVRQPYPGAIIVTGHIFDSLLSISLDSDVLEATVATSPAQMLAFVDAAAEMTHRHKANFPNNPLAPDSALHLALTSESNPSFSETEFVKWRSSLARTAAFQLCENFNPTNEKKFWAQTHPDLLSRSGITFDFLESSTGRRFGISEKGRLCLVPPLTRVGDIIWIPSGAQAPYIVRQKPQSSGSLAYELVGEAYIQGVMHGEAVQVDMKILRFCWYEASRTTHRELAMTMISTIIGTPLPREETDVRRLRGNLDCTHWTKRSPEECIVQTEPLFHDAIESLC